MLFSDRPRTHYPSAPVHEVICQLRFPTILTINNVEPADFQEAIRADFPQYARRQETPPPVPQAPGTAQPAPVSNYHFLSEDNQWKLNLTKDFIALSTIRYPGWEAFAGRLDKALAAFIRTYQPAYFQRVGLRYVNLISRKRLDLEDTPWTDLIAPAYTGAMADPELREEDCLSFGTDLQLKLDNSCRAKIHAGLARLQVKGPNAPQQDPELRFVFDLDLSMNGNVPCTMAAGALETLHIHGGRIFEGAVTQELRDAMSRP